MEALAFGEGLLSTTLITFQLWFTLLYVLMIDRLPVYQQDRQTERSKTKKQKKKKNVNEEGAK
jgi:hypothetical protein